MAETPPGSAGSAEQPKTIWVHQSFVVRPSGIEGCGLFTTENLDAGTLVLRLGGRLVTTLELGQLMHRATADPSHGCVDTLTVHEDAHLVLPPGSLVHFGNHSCDPNMWHLDAYEIATRRAIQTGEELTIDYGTQSGAAGFSMACHCGSPLCRGLISSDDWRLPTLQTRYRRHWVPALEDRISAL